MTDIGGLLIVIGFTTIALIFVIAINRIRETNERIDRINSNIAQLYNFNESVRNYVADLERWVKLREFYTKIPKPDLGPYYFDAQDDDYWYRAPSNIVEMLENAGFVRLKSIDEYHPSGICLYCGDDFGTDSRCKHCGAPPITDYRIYK